MVNTLGIYVIFISTLMLVKIVESKYIDFSNCSEIVQDPEFSKKVGSSLKTKCLVFANCCLYNCNFVMPYEMKCQEQNFVCKCSNPLTEPEEQPESISLATSIKLPAISTGGINTDMTDADTEETAVTNPARVPSISSSSIKIEISTEATDSAIDNATSVTPDMLDVNRLSTAEWSSTSSYAIDRSTDLTGNNSESTELADSAIDNATSVTADTLDVNRLSTTEWNSTSSYAIDRSTVLTGNNSESTEPTDSAIDNATSVTPDTLDVNRLSTAEWSSTSSYAIDRPTDLTDNNSESTEPTHSAIDNATSVTPDTLDVNRLSTAEWSSTSSYAIDRSTDLTGNTSESTEPTDSAIHNATGVTADTLYVNRLSTSEWSSTSSYAIDRSTDLTGNTSESNSLGIDRLNSSIQQTTYHSNMETSTTRQPKTSAHVEVDGISSYHNTAPTLNAFSTYQTTTIKDIIAINGTIAPQVGTTTIDEIACAVHEQLCKFYKSVICNSGSFGGCEKECRPVNECSENIKVCQEIIDSGCSQHQWMCDYVC